MGLIGLIYTILYIGLIRLVGPMGFIREIMGMKEPTGLISRVLKTGKMDETISMTSVNTYTLFHV